MSKDRLKVLFENDKCIAVDKPAGVLVIPDQYTERSSTLHGAVTAYAGSKIWIVHRIDRDTTGVVLFAKDPESHSFLCRQFEKGETRKKYLALVNGSFPADHGVIDKPIAVEGRSVSISAAGKESLTEYRVVEQFRNFALVEAYPRTGRRHQIRVHFWAIGHPLAVDKEYYSREALCLSEFKRSYKSSGREKPLIARLSLHAASLQFTDPHSGKPAAVESPVPDDFEITLKQLRKYNA